MGRKAGRARAEGAVGVASGLDPVGSRRGDAQPGTGAAPDDTAGVSGPESRCRSVGAGVSGPESRGAANEGRRRARPAVRIGAPPGSSGSFSASVAAVRSRSDAPGRARSRAGHRLRMTAGSEGFGTDRSVGSPHCAVRRGSNRRSRGAPRPPVGERSPTILGLGPRSTRKVVLLPPGGTRPIRRPRAPRRPPKRPSEERDGAAARGRRTLDPTRFRTPVSNARS